MYGIICQYEQCFAVHGTNSAHAARESFESGIRSPPAESARAGYWTTKRTHAIPVRPIVRQSGVGWRLHALGASLHPVYGRSACRLPKLQNGAVQSSRPRTSAPGLSRASTALAAPKAAAGVWRCRSAAPGASLPRPARGRGCVGRTATPPVRSDSGTGLPRSMRGQSCGTDEARRSHLSPSSGISSTPKSRIRFGCCCRRTPSCASLMTCVQFSISAVPFKQAPSSNTRLRSNASRWPWSAEARLDDDGRASAPAA